MIFVDITKSVRLNSNFLLCKKNFNLKKNMKKKNSILPKLNLINVAPVSLNVSHGSDIDFAAPTQIESARVENKKKIVVGQKVKPPQTSRVQKITRPNQGAVIKEMSDKFTKETMKCQTEYEKYTVAKNSFDTIVQTFPAQAQSLLAVKNGYENEIERIQEKVNELIEKQKVYHVSERGFNSEILAVQQKIDSKRKALDDRIATILEQQELTTEDNANLRKNIEQRTKEGGELKLRSENSVFYLQELTMSMNSSKIEYDALKKEFDKNADEIEKMKQKIEDSRNDISLVLSSIYNTNQYIEKENKEISVQQQKIDDCNSRIEKLTKELNEKKRIQSQKKQEIADIQREIDDINKGTADIKESLIFLNDAYDIGKLPEEPVQLLQFYLACFGQKL